MPKRTSRRTLLRQLPVALAGAMSITAANAGFRNEKPNPSTAEPLEVIAPDRIAARQPFALQVRLPQVECGSEGTRWVELWLGKQYLGRWEMAGPVSAASVTVTLTLSRSATLRVRDFYGRVVTKRLQVR